MKRWDASPALLEQCLAMTVAISLFPRFSFAKTVYGWEEQAELSCFATVSSPNGRLWFGTTRGLAWLDSATLDNRRNHVVPPVVIEALVTGGKNFISAGPANLLAHTNSIQFDYTALSLSLPEPVRFRYHLEGVDKEWQNASARRQAFYTNLSPGHYRFHVTASNNDGVWNNDGASGDFTIAPAFYQRWQFRVMVALAFATLLWAMIQQRISSMTVQMQARLAARSDERERIARELHDTLLQSLYGVMLKFHSIVERLSLQDPYGSVCRAESRTPLVATRLRNLWRALRR